MNPEELLNKYLDRELDPVELNEFDSLYQSSLNFRNQVERYRDIMKGIEWSEIQKIRSEVNLAHQLVIPELKASLQFEDDLTKSLSLKNRQKVKEEIQNAMNTKAKKTGTVLSLNFRTQLAIAASLIVIISIAVFVVWNRKASLTPEAKEVMVQAYTIARLEVQLTGVADPSKETNIHESRVFEFLAKNEIKQASDANTAFYQDHVKDFRYHQILGWIYYHSGKWTQAREAFLIASKMGDPCMSKLLYAFLIPYEKQSQEIIAEVKADASCKSSESVNQLLDRISK